MPKLYDYLGIIILFYSNDHEPIHVHGKYQGFESKAELIIIDGKVVAINILAVKGKESLQAKELKEFKRFVTLFKDDIVQKWVDYFVYHKNVEFEKITKRLK